MTSVQQIEVAAGEGEQRLDRWFRRKFPGLSHVRLEKLLRTGQVRLDGKRAKASDRVLAGQIVRVPPMDPISAPSIERPKNAGIGKPDQKWLSSLRNRILLKDADVLVIDKPAGLAVQGGSGLDTNLDALLDHLRFDAAERPRLVHRLDRDTSGVLVLARNVRAARSLTEAFRHKDAHKTYLAIVVGIPKPSRGRIDAPLMKVAGRMGERVEPDEEGKRAVTYYVTLDRAGTKTAVLALMPVTGRTHQLRAHCAALGTPILGDRKYGGAGSMLPGGNLTRELHLHARRIQISHPTRGKIDVTAPLPLHFKRALDFLGLRIDEKDDPFADLKG